MTSFFSRIFSQKPMQTQIAQGEILTLPLESAQEGLEGPLEAPLSPSPETPFRPPPQKAFRLAVRRLFLTYSQVPEEMMHENVLESLKKKLTFQNYLIAKETHADGGAHFHVILIAGGQKKFDIKNANLINIDYREEVYPGYYQRNLGQSNFSDCVLYACKEGDYKTNLENVINGKMLNIHDEFRIRFERDGEDLAKIWILDNYQSKLMSGCGYNLDRMVKVCREKRDLNLKMQMEKKEPAFTSFDQFNISEKIRQWMTNNYQPTGIFVGDGGTGKTCFVHMIAHINGWKMITMCDREDFKKYNDSFDAIFFDDFVFKNFNQQELLALLETDQARTINVKNGSVVENKGC